MSSRASAPTSDVKNALEQINWHAVESIWDFTFPDQLLELTWWVFIGWPVHSTITRMGDKTCCQSWWTILGLLVEFDSFYGCFFFFSKPVHLIVLLFSSIPSQAPIDKLLPWKPNRRDLRKPLQAWVRAAESRAAAQACPLMRIVKRLWPEPVLQSCGIL